MILLRTLHRIFVHYITALAPNWQVPRCKVDVWTCLLFVETQETLQNTMTWMQTTLQRISIRTFHSTEHSMCKAARRQVGSWCTGTSSGNLLILRLFPQIAGSYRGSNFSKGGIVLANWPTSGCCSECCAGCCQGCCCACCPGCSGSCLPLGGVRVLCRGAVEGAVQGAPDHVCHWAVSGCCAG